MKHSVAFLCGVALLSALALGAVDAQEGAMTSFPESPNTLTFTQDGEFYFEIAFGGWGPNWSYFGLGGKVTEDDQTAVMTSGAKVNTGAQLTLVNRVSKTGPRQITLEMSLSTTQTTDLTMLMGGLNLNDSAFEGGKAVVTTADGEESTVDFPLARKGLGKKVAKFTYVDAAGQQTTFSLKPGLDISSDGQARVMLATHVDAARPVEAVMTIDLPAPVTFYTGPASVPQDPGFEDWYTFSPKNDYTLDSEISMADWLEKPAGKHGRVLRDAEGDLVYNGRPIKLWGLNVCYASCAPDKELADKRAGFYAKNGINTVRLHKYADGAGWAGIQSEESFVEFDEAGLDRLDYFIAQLKNAGIYVKLSSTFGVKLGPADRKYVPYMDEFGQLRNGRGRVSTGHGSVFLSTELQSMQIEQIVRLLKHKNPYTGLTYAEDPAIVLVEMFNEDSALFYGTMGRLQNIPTLRKRGSEMFTKWLKARYGTKEKLLEAWGDAALDSFGHEKLTGEKWEDNTIVPAGNPWYWDPAQLEGSQAFRKRRLLDTAQFLYELQNHFYDRYLAAIRAAGYEGEVMASNWQAGRAYSHYLNLHSDYRIGLIDRHNYFGGGGGSKINNNTMLRVPGSGSLSSGMQQVVDRPFSLSEWIHVAPNEWGMEGPAIIGAYGMGLQGWDISYIFQNRDDGGFADRIEGGGWNVSAPQVIGVFPGVSRQVLRMDVKESDVLAKRYVHVPSLQEGKLGFDDRVTQDWDVKTFSSDAAPSQTLAVARAVIEFTDEFQQTKPFDLTPYVEDGVYTSTTGQLRWKAGESKMDGFFTMNTPGTKAVVGFANGEVCKLGAVTIAPKSRYGGIYVSGKDRADTVAAGDNLVIVAIARARNTDMKVFQDSRIIQRGKPPVVMEPVKATITLDRPGNATVHVLDHDGVRTGTTIPVTNGTFEIDGARDKTCYYLVSFTD